MRPSRCAPPVHRARSVAAWWAPWSATGAPWPTPWWQTTSPRSIAPPLPSAAIRAGRSQGRAGWPLPTHSLVTEGRVQGSTVTLAGNRADGVQSTGYAAQAGGGLLFSASQQSAALANTLAVTGSQLDASTLTVAGNTASRLDSAWRCAHGQQRGARKRVGGAFAALCPCGTLSGNNASDIATTADSARARAGGLAGRESRARAPPTRWCCTTAR